MLVDHSLQFTADGGQALTAAAASEKFIDLEQVGRTDMSKQLFATFVVDTDVTGTVQFKLQECDTESGTYGDCAMAAALSAPKAGTVVQIPFPLGTKRYVKAYFGGTPTAGKVHAFLTIGRQQWHAAAQAESLKDAFVTEQA